MDKISSAQAKLKKRMRESRCHLLGTATLGIGATCLAFFGQTALSRARPLFSLLTENYSAWQSSYNVLLCMLAVAWIAAIVQQSLRHLDLRDQLALQKQRDAQLAHARVVQEVPEAVEPEVEPTGAISLAQQEAVARLLAQNRQGRFDY